MVIILASLGVFFYPNIREWKTQQEVEQIMVRFENDFKTDEPETEDSSTEKKDASKESENEQTADNSTESTDTSSDEHEITNFVELYQEMEDYNKRLATEGQNIEDAWSYEQPPLTLTHMPNHDYTIGYINIPDMKIRLPLFLGASMDNLSKGAAVMSETSMPIGGADTNCVIAGHRGWQGSAFFQRIEDLKIGSDIYITNPWETLIYRVTSTKVVDPNDSNAILLQPGKDMVTLLTCHPYVLGGGPYRYIVYCERVGTEDRDTSIKIENPSVEEPPAEEEQEVVADTTDTDDIGSVQISSEELEASENLLKWEKYLRVGLPAGTLILCLIIILARRRK